MTNTRAINSAAGVIHAAMQQGRTLPTSIAFALDSACLLNSPEIAAELVQLRELPAEVERLSGSLAAMTSRVTGAEKRRAELEAVLRTHRDDDRAEIERLRARVAELEPGPCRNRSPYGRLCDRPTGHDGDHGMADGAGGHFGWPASEDVTPQVQKLRGLIARQRREWEDPHDSPLSRSHHPVPQDMPEVRP